MKACDEVYGGEENFFATSLTALLISWSEILVLPSNEIFARPHSFQAGGDTAWARAWPYHHIKGAFPKGK